MRHFHKDRRYRITGNSPMPILDTPTHPAETTEESFLTRSIMAERPIEDEEDYYGDGEGEDEVDDDHDDDFEEDDYDEESGSDGDDDDNDDDDDHLDGNEDDDFINDDEDLG